MQHYIKLFFLGCFAITAYPVKAQEISHPVLRDINNTVRSLCSAPDRQGEEWTVELGASGEATIKLVDLKVEATFSKEEWNGIKDYLEDRPDLRQCVRDLTSKFLEKIPIEYEKESRADKYINFVKFGIELGMLVSHCECLFSAGLSYPNITDPPEMKLQVCSSGSYYQFGHSWGGSTGSARGQEEQVRNMARSIGFEPHATNVVVETEVNAYEVGLPNLFSSYDKISALTHYLYQANSIIEKRLIQVGLSIYEYSIYYQTYRSGRRSVPGLLRSGQKAIPQAELQQVGARNAWFDKIKDCAGQKEGEVLQSVKDNLISAGLEETLDRLLSFGSEKRNIFFRWMPYIEGGIRQVHG